MMTNINNNKHATAQANPLPVHRNALIFAR